KGLDGNDDAGLEAEADTWGARAAAGEPVGRSSAAAGAGAAASIQRKVVQRSPQTSHYGRFVDTEYRVDNAAQTVHLHQAGRGARDAALIRHGPMTRVPPAPVRRNAGSVPVASITTQ